MPPKIEITADDWGFSPGVNLGILELARLGVVRRVSVLSHSVYVKEELDSLRAVPGVGFGLHFNLTQTEKHKGLASFAYWWCLSRESKTSKQSRVQEALREQFESLKSHGIKPTSIEGHHHVQILPGMIQAISPVIREYGVERVRIPKDHSLFFSLKFPIPLLSMRAERELQAEGFPIPTPCIYPSGAHFRNPVKLKELIERFPGYELIAHPAAFDDLEQAGCTDSYREGRVTEYEGLKCMAGIFNL